MMTIPTIPRTTRTTSPHRSLHPPPPPRRVGKRPPPHLPPRLRPLRPRASPQLAKRSRPRRKRRRNRQRPSSLPRKRPKRSRSQSRRKRRPDPGGWTTLHTTFAFVFSLFLPPSIVRGLPMRSACYTPTLRFILRSRTTLLAIVTMRLPFLSWLGPNVLVVDPPS